MTVSRASARPSSPGASDDQKGLGERDEAVDLLDRGVDRGAEAVGVLAVAEGELELGAVQGERGAELVARVVDEPALALDRRLEALEHLVQRRPEASELVIGWRHREPLARIAGRDLGGPAAHPFDRVQGGSGSPVPRERRQEERDRAADQKQRRESHERFVAIVERGPDHHRKVVGLVGRRDEQAGAGVEVGQRGPLDLGRRLRRREGSRRA